MQIWLKTLFRNSFFQVGIGLFVTMIFGGFVLQWLETGDISKGNNPFWWAIVTMTTVGYGDFSPSTGYSRVFTILYIFLGITVVFFAKSGRVSRTEEINQTSSRPI